MASLQNRGSRGWLFRFGKRTRNKDSRVAINLGQLTEDDAFAGQRHLEHLLECQKFKTPPRRETLAWLKELDPKIHSRVASKGLCDDRFDEHCRTVRGLCEHFLDWKRLSLEPASMDVYEKTTKMLIHYFGGGRDIATINPADVDDLVRWCYDKGSCEHGLYNSPLAKTTASRRVQTIKSIFRRAARKRWIETSAFYEMFESLPRQTRTNPRRQHWVDAEVVQKVIDRGAGNNEQRLIFALARWGGLRIPSELLPITWSDVDWDAEKIRIRAKKQKNHEYKRERWIPIWPEIRPYLDEAWTEAKPGYIWVINQYRSPHTSSHRAKFCRACHRIGLVDDREKAPWPKLWINMRSTRATELRKSFPSDVVDYWLNHSEQVSKTHYQQWDSFEWRECG